MKNLKFNFNVPTWLWVFINLLQITFITLKLFNIISWNWFWVLSPLWIVMGLVYILWLLFSIILFIKWIKA